MPRTLQRALLVFTAAGAALVVGTFLPWLHSGSTARSSYALVGLVDRLDITPGGPAALLIGGWPFVPLLVTSAVVLAWWGRSTASLVVAAVAAIYAGGIAAVLAVGSSGTPITVGIGTWVCATAGLAFLAGGVWVRVRAASVRVPGTRRAAPSADPS
jgi:hypothetical protein